MATVVLFGRNSSPPFGMSIGNYSAIYGGVNDYGLVLYSANLPVLIPGNVGIGTTSPGAKLDVNGALKVSGSVESPVGTIRDANGGWIRTYGDTGWYSQTYGGGWYMSDPTWIRTYNSKNIYQNAGILRTDGELQVGDSGNRFVVKGNGNVGIGTASPTAKLDVDGAVQANAVSVTGGALNLNHNPSTITATGRMHITGTERLYILNKNGLIIGKDWGGDGSLSVQGIADVGYLKIMPWDNDKEGGEMQLIGAGSYGNWQLDNYCGNARIHGLAAGKRLEVMGGSVLATAFNLKFPPRISDLPASKAL